ncbi:MAG: hypothetical protein ACYTGC_09905 [Planctomycetota bacterium]|jgi:hypothetical protein
MANGEWLVAVFEYPAVIARAFLISVAFLLLGGCGTCVTVKGTYNEVWAATSEVMESIDQRGTGPPMRSFFGQGSIEVVTEQPLWDTETHYRAQIEPVGSDEVRDHKVCVRVLRLEPAPDEPEAVRSQRRSDLEKLVAQQIQRRVQRIAPPALESEE